MLEASSDVSKRGSPNDGRNRAAAKTPCFHHPHCRPLRLTAWFGLGSQLLLVLVLVLEDWLSQDAPFEQEYEYRSAEYEYEYRFAEYEYEGFEARTM